MMRKRILIPALSAVVLAAGVATIMNTTSTPTESTSFATTVNEQPAIAVDAAPTTDVTTTPVATSANVPPPATQAPQPVAVTAPASNPYKDEMAQAGISASDYATVASLLLNADGSWIAPGTSYGVWLAATTHETVDKFIKVNRFVVNTYGSWAGAQAMFESNGGNW